METKELSEIVTVALEGIIQDRIKKYVAENQREIARTFLEVDDEKLQKIIDSKENPSVDSPLSVDRVKKFIEDWEENTDVLHDIMTDKAMDRIGRLWIEQHDGNVEDCLDDQEIESVAKNWIDNNNSDACDYLNDSLYDSDARDFVTALIERHW